MNCCVGGGEGRGYLRSTWVQMFAALVMSVNVQLCVNFASSSRGGPRGSCFSKRPIFNPSGNFDLKAIPAG